MERLSLKETIHILGNITKDEISLQDLVKLVGKNVELGEIDWNIPEGIDDLLNEKVDAFSYKIPIVRFVNQRNYFAEKPERFDWNPFGVKAWLDVNGQFKYDLDMSQFDLTLSDKPYENFFVAKGGNFLTTNDGKDPANPLGGIYAVISRINTNKVENAVIWITPEVYTDGAVWGSTNPISSNITIKVWNRSKVAPFKDTSGAKITMTTETSNLVWTLTEDSLYTASRSSVAQVVDLSEVNEFGDGRQYAKVSNLEQCKALKGSWFQNGGSVVINKINEKEPTAKDIKAYVAKANAVAGEGKYTVYIENMDFLGGTVAFQGTSNKEDGEEIICFKNCDFMYTTGNALGMSGILSCITINCKASYAGLDGFNYHYSATVPNKKTRNLEVSCTSYSNGNDWSSVKGSNNGSTIHDGCYIARFNCVTSDNEGANFADVGGSYVWMFNCLSKNSKAPNNDHTRADYYNSDGFMWLDHCDSVGKSLYSLSSVGRNAQTYVRDCNLPKGVYGHTTINIWE